MKIFHSITTKPSEFWPKIPKHVFTFSRFPLSVPYYLIGPRRGEGKNEVITENSLFKQTLPFSTKYMGPNE